MSKIKEIIIKECKLKDKIAETDIKNGLNNDSFLEFFSSKNNIIFIVPREKGFYSKIIKDLENKDTFIKDYPLFETILEGVKDCKERSKDLIVCFFMPDQFIKNKYKEKDPITEQELDEMYFDIIEIADTQFSMVRHFFFKKIIDVKEYELFEDFKNIRFVSQIIPFWRWK